MGPKPRSDGLKKNREKTGRREVEVERGVYVAEGAAPAAGMKLTPELIKEDLRALNRRRRLTEAGEEDLRAAGG